MLYDAEHDTIASHRGLLERTILLDGFSKTFAMTGWRLGYAAMPKELVEPVTRLIINSVSCTAPRRVQLAGVAALTGPRDEVNVDADLEFRRRREAVVAGLNALPGVSCINAGKRRFLCLPEHLWDRVSLEGAGRPAARRGEASPCFRRGRPSVPTARGTSAGSRTRTRSRTSSRRSRRSALLLAEGSAA